MKIPTYYKFENSPHLTKKGNKMSQFYIRQSKNKKTIREFAHEDKQKVDSQLQAWVNELPIHGSIIEVRDFSKPDSLIETINL